MSQHPAAEQHLRYLDSARGIAAFIVFFGHFLDRALHGHRALNWLGFLFNGSDAVSFFFVLSGFVLSYKYVVLRRPLDVRKFWVTRVFRIYPAFFIIVVLNVLLLYRNELSLHKLAELFVFNKTGFWQEAILLRFHNTYYFPGWTLTFEMVCSLLMPFYISLALTDRRLVPAMLVVLIVIGNTFAFSSHFLLGIIISSYYFVFSSPAFRESRWFRFRYLIILVAIFLFSVRRIDMISPFGPDYRWLADFLNIDYFHYSGLASFVFLVAIIQSRRTQRLLQTRPLIFLGQISYSVYLVHTLCLNIVYYVLVPYVHLHGVALLAFITATYFLLTLVFAIAMYRAVELPSIRLGKRISARIRPSVVLITRS